jgi:hypothetical protein
LPDHDDEHPDYHVPLQDLTGKHGYALVRGEDDDSPPDPGAPVAYVADPMKERPNTMTVEGAIIGIGNMAAGAAKEGGTPEWVLRGLLAAFLIPILIILVARLTEWL